MQSETRRELKLYTGVQSPLKITATCESLNETILDTLLCKEYFSFLGGYSGYNQILIAPEDQDKTTFSCPWGTYAY